MNGKFTDDRLSAYFDDQMSLEERAAFEQELAASPELRSELAVFRQMSDLLHQIPQAKAPVELFPSIMRGIERETLLPATEAPTSRKVRWRNLVAVAACGLVAAVAASSFLGNNQQVARNDNTETSPVSMSVKKSRELANKNQSVVGQEAPNKTQEFQIDPQDLATAKPGDQISAISTDGISVIRLTVVDLKQEATALRALLAGAEIKPLTNDTEEVANGLVAVYVQSDAAKIVSALEKMKKELGIESMSTPVTLEASDPKVQEVLAGAKDAADNTQQTVAVKAESELDLLTQKAEKADAKAIPVAMKGAKRVIFLISKPAPKAGDKNTNGASA